MRNTARCGTGHDRPESAVTIAGIRNNLKEGVLMSAGVEKRCFLGLSERFESLSVRDFY
jgi:hypothetical protein